MKNFVVTFIYSIMGSRNCQKVEIYLNDGKEDGTTCFYLYKIVTKENKDELQLVMFPNLKTDFDELFNL